MNKKQSALLKTVLPLFLFAALLFAGCPQESGGGSGTQPSTPLTAPQAPAKPTVTPGSKQLAVSWTAVQSATSYEVWYHTADSSAGAQKFGGDITGTSVTITGLTNGTAWYVWLKAKNTAGTSGFGPSATGTPEAQGPQPSVIQGNTELSIGWAAESGAVYEVWHSASNNSAGAQKFSGTVNTNTVNNVTTKNAVITGLTNGTAHYVWLKVTADGQTSGFSTAVPGTPEAPPAAVTGFVYIPGGTIVGSDSWALTVTVPNDPAYTFAGQTSVQKGVFVEGRVVKIDSFLMAKYETTRQLWYDVQDWATANGYYFKAPISDPASSNPNQPVTNINWRDAVVWCNAYSEKDGLDPVYTSGGSVLKDSRDSNAATFDAVVMDKTKSGYRLPTEAEREFAARGGDPGKADWMYTYAGNNNAEIVAWHHGNSANTLKDVGGKNANRLGVYDLSGNAQEWGWDWMLYSRITAATPADGEPYSSTYNQKPIGGGGVGSNITMSCVSYRWSALPTYTDGYIGFRVVRGLP